MDFSSNLMNILLSISYWTNPRDFPDFFLYLFWPTLSEHAVHSQTSGDNKALQNENSFGKKHQHFFLTLITT